MIQRIKFDKRAPRLLAAECYGWSHYSGNGRDGWSLHVYEKDTYRSRYFSANFLAGEGYRFYEVTNGGSAYQLISGPYKRLDDVKQAGIDHLVELYWLNPKY